MTTNYRRDWFRDGSIYHKQAFINTDYERSPNSAIEAIDHFSKPRKIRRYVNPLGYINNGFPLKGEPEIIELWCMIRTIWAGRKEESYDVFDNGNIRTEGSLALYYNPYHEHHPEEGIHLHLSNPRSEETTDYSGFADIIEYNSLLWKVTEHNTYDVSYGSGKEYMGKATISRYKEPIESLVDVSPSPQDFYQIK